MKQPLKNQFNQNIPSKQIHLPKWLPKNWSLLRVLKKLVPWHVSSASAREAREKMAKKHGTFSSGAVPKWLERTFVVAYRWWAFVLTTNCPVSDQTFKIRSFKMTPMFFTSGLAGDRSVDRWKWGLSQPSRTAGHFQKLLPLHSSLFTKMIQVWYV